MSVIVSDAFNRADNASSLGNADTGQAWNALSGTWGITGNKAYKSATNGAEHVAVIDAGIADVDISLDVVAVGTLGVVYIAFRVVDTSNYWVGQIFNGASGTGIFKYEGGSKDSVGAITRSLVGPTIRIVADADSLKLYDNGTLIVSRTSNFNQSATKHGLQAYNTNTTYDNFSLSDLVPPATNARITRQSVEAAQVAAFPADNVRLTRQSIELAQFSPYTLNNLRVSRQSVEVAQLGANNGFPEDAARLTQQTVEVLYLDPPADTTHDQDCYSRMRRL